MTVDQLRDYIRENRELDGAERFPTIVAALIIAEKLDALTAAIREKKE